MPHSQGGALRREAIDASLHGRITIRGRHRVINGVPGVSVLICDEGSGIPPEEGARTSVFLATAAEVAGTSGGYFARCEPRQLATAPEAVADEVCDRLWNVSEALVAPFAGAASDSTQAGTRA